MKNLIRFGAYIVPVFMLVAWMGLPFYKVENGFVGVETCFGAITAVHSPGAVFKKPFCDIREEPTQVSNFNPGAPASAATKDLQSVHVPVSVNYQFQSSSIGDIYEVIGGRAQFEEFVLNPGLQEALKSVTARYSAYDLQQNRGKVAADAAQLLAEWVAQTLKDRGLEPVIQTSEMNLGDFDYSDAFETALKETSTAAQKEGEADANRRSTITNAEAEAARIVREAEAKAFSIRKDADAEHDGMVAKAKQLLQNPQLPCYLLHRKWLGQMPEVSNGQNFLPFSEVCNVK